MWTFIYLFFCYIKLIVQFKFTHKIILTKCHIIFLPPKIKIFDLSMTWRVNIMGKIYVWVGCIFLSHKIGKLPTKKDCGKMDVDCRSMNLFIGLLVSMRLFLSFIGFGDLEYISENPLHMVEPLCVMCLNEPRILIKSFAR